MNISQDKILPKTTTEKEFRGILVSGLRKLKAIVRARYYAVCLFDPFREDFSLVESNNPSTSENAYLTELFKHDFLLDEMVQKNKGRILSDLESDKPEHHRFLEEYNSLRPAGDRCYVPLMIRKVRVGFVALVRGEGAPSFNVEELFLVENYLALMSEDLFRRFLDNHIVSSCCEIKGHLRVGTFLYNVRGDEICAMESTVPEIMSELLATHVCTSLELENVREEMVVPFLRSDSASLDVEARGEFYRVVNCNHVHSGKSSDRGIFRLYGLFKKRSYGAIIAERAEGYNLTKREIDLLRLVLEGKSNQDIAGETGISVGTVKKHISNIFIKTGVNSRNRLITLFLQ